MPSRMTACPQLQGMLRSLRQRGMLVTVACCLHKSAVLAVWALQAS